MFAKEIAQEIRKVLKSNGINSRQVSVKVQNGCYESAIYCTIKDKAIDSQKVSDLVKPFEKVSFDEFSGEILSGGNTFIFVN